MRWEELSAPEIAALDRGRTIAVLPVGSVEQHGRHLPVGTDTVLAPSVALEAAGRLAGRPAVLPARWYGCPAPHTRPARTVTLKPPTMLSLIEDAVAPVVEHALRRIAVVNGHGGNNRLSDVLASTLGNRFYG